MSSGAFTSFQRTPVLLGFSTAHTYGVNVVRQDPVDGLSLCGRTAAAIATNLLRGGNRRHLTDRNSKQCVVAAKAAQVATVSVEMWLDTNHAGAVAA